MLSFTYRVLCQLACAKNDIYEFRSTKSGDNGKLSMFLFC